MRLKHINYRFKKTCSKCKQLCNDIDAIIPCRGWNDISCKKDSYEYWIHTPIDYYQTKDDVNYCTSCFIILNSLSNDDNTKSINDVIFRRASIDDDVITEFNSDGLEGASIT